MNDSKVLRLGMAYRAEPIAPEMLFQRDLRPEKFVFENDDGTFSHSASHNNHQLAGLVAHEHNGYPQKYLAEEGSYYVCSVTHAEAGYHVYASLKDGFILTDSENREISGYIDSGWKVLQGGKLVR